MLCPTCGGRTDFSRDPYVCPTGIVSNEECLYQLEQVVIMASKIETPTTPSEIWNWGESF
jgi:hypothetical protein